MLFCSVFRIFHARTTSGAELLSGLNLKSLVSTIAEYTVSSSRVELLFRKRRALSERAQLHSDCLLMLVGFPFVGAPRS